MAQEEIKSCISDTLQEHCRENGPEKGNGTWFCKYKSNENKYSLQA